MRPEMMIVQRSFPAGWEKKPKLTMDNAGVESLIARAAARPLRKTMSVEYSGLRSVTLQGRGCKRIKAQPTNCSYGLPNMVIPKPWNS